MRYLLAAILIASGFMARATELDKEVNKSIVLVRQEPKPDGTGNSSGTGVFIADNLVLTCYHVVDNDTGLRIEYKNAIYPAKIARFSEDKDLAVLRADVPNEQIMDLAENPAKVFDKLKMYGYLQGMWRVWKLGAVLTQRNVRLGPQPVFKAKSGNTPSQKGPLGMSGGPVVIDKQPSEHKVALIGISSKINKNNTKEVYIIDLNTIKEFLEK